MKNHLSQKITAAFRDRNLVRIERKVERGWTNGFVVQAGVDWLLLLVVGNDIRYAGFEVIRRKDIRSLDNPAPYSDFVLTALRIRRERRPKAQKIDLTNLAALFSSLIKTSLVTIHREIITPDICNIGRIISVGGNSIELLEINPDATWDADPVRHKFSQITRVDFGGPYEQALKLVASRKFDRKAK